MFWCVTCCFEQSEFSEEYLSTRLTDWYIGDQGSPANPELSPLLQATFANLPPAIVQVAGRDPLRDGGLLYEKLLKEAKVRTKLHMCVVLPLMPYAVRCIHEGQISWSAPCIPLDFSRLQSYSTVS